MLFVTQMLHIIVEECGHETWLNTLFSQKQQFGGRIACRSDFVEWCCMGRNYTPAKRKAFGAAETWGFWAWASDSAQIKLDRWWLII